MLQEIKINSAIYSITIIALFFICITGCNNRKSPSASYNKSDIIWADTITYEVLISNPDSLNEWEAIKVKNVRQKELVNSLFEMVYTGEKKAYHYYTNEALSIGEIKEIENDTQFSRDKVGKLQFTETWVYNKEAQKLEKKVYSILIAYELYNDYNELRGYKAAFYLKDF